MWRIGGWVFAHMWLGYVARRLRQATWLEELPGLHLSLAGECGRTMKIEDEAGFSVAELGKEMWLGMTGGAGAGSRQKSQPGVVIWSYKMERMRFLFRLECCGQICWAMLECG
ncbi:Hypothetical predicted protein [Prunus dulcis]|uniref:Uncharacterized protein n=1 Tax=Prunus dulcis TaxID=3755 RepID=A0A5E4GMK5_PRUDU|nr:Hypothetical predicted protein [Prunus dulcis]